MIALTFKAIGDRVEREHRDRAWLAWHVAALMKCDPKKFPKLSDLTGVKAPPKVQTADEIRAAMAGIRAAARKRALPTSGEGSREVAGANKPRA